MKYILILALICFNLLFSCVKDNKASSIFSKIVFLDPGHGGFDNGCTYDDVYEDEINLNIATYLYEECIKNQMICYISRTGDYDLSYFYSKNHKNDDLKKRAKYIEESSCDIFISLHLNSYSSYDVYGPMVYYEKENEKSYLLAEICQKKLNEFTSLNKIVHYEDFYLFKKTSKVGVLIECGFLSNYNERNKLVNKVYQKQLGHIIFLSIEEYFSSLV